MNVSRGGYWIWVTSLPAIVAKRQSNRGIEALAISPDERFLYFIMQNPLANPDTAAFQQARNTRLADYRSDPDAVRIGIDPAAIRADTGPRIAAWNDLGRGICGRFLEAASRE